jgi:hypothetical protein
MYPCGASEFTPVFSGVRITRSIDFYPHQSPPTLPSLLPLTLDCLRVCLLGKLHPKGLAEGVYLAPSAYEAGFVSTAHSDADIQKTIDLAESVFAKF